jgi:cytochrome c oxidase subunit 4
MAHPPASASPSDHPRVGHVVSPALLLAVWGALMVLTVLTVVVTRFDFGPFNLWVALVIAVVKASLVALYFMHLRWDRPMNAVVFLASLAFVALFVGGALTDTEEYQGDLIPGYAPRMQR